MTTLIHIGQRQNSSSSYFPSCGKIDSVFKLSECKQESECKVPMSSAAGAGVTFFGAGVKKSDSDHLCLECHERSTNVTISCWRLSGDGSTLNL